MITWHIVDSENPDQIYARVSFGQSAADNQTGLVTIDTDSDEIRNFITYYLADPLNSGRVYIEGLGVCRGPHWDNPEQFEYAMAVLGFHFPSFGTKKKS